MISFGINFNFLSFYFFCPQVRVDLEAGTGRRSGVGEEVVARCPARVDLAGGWTDTPPICYELGGRVVGMALQVGQIRYFLSKRVC